MDCCQKAILRKKEPIFLLAWRLKKHIKRSENDWQLLECYSYTVRVVREARCLELLLFIVLATW